MKYQNQKQDDQEEKQEGNQHGVEEEKQEGNPSQEGGDITQLDGSPAPDAVSKVAMGGDATNDDEHTEVYNSEWISRLKGKQPGKEVMCDIEDAYAMLFEGLAGIMRHK